MRTVSGNEVEAPRDPIAIVSKPLLFTARPSLACHRLIYLFAASSVRLRILRLPTCGSPSVLHRRHARRLLCAVVDQLYGFI